MRSDRRRKVLNALIEEYISTASPVSSRAIVGKHGLGVSSATVRNELYVLEEDGYVTSPHVSSGRIPTDTGYRSFVDDLLDAAAEKDEEEPRTDGELAEDLRESAMELDDLLKQTSRDIANLEGTGAAGGIASVFLAFLNASLGSGIDFVLDVTDFDEKVKDADLVITGEGRIDAQSACGKVPYGVAKRTKKHGNIPVIAIGGSLGEGYEELYSVGVDAMLSSVNGICTLDEAMKSAVFNVERASADAMKFVLIPRK